MTPSQLRAKVVAGRADWVRQMLDSIRALPLDTYQNFLIDSRNVAAAESYLRRCLEALLDLGRHILAKGFGETVEKSTRNNGRIENSFIIPKSPFNRNVL